MLTFIINAESCKTALERAEKEIYKKAMEIAKNNKVKAARLVGVSRGTFYTNLKKHFGNLYRKREI